MNKSKLMLAALAAIPVSIGMIGEVEAEGAAAPDIVAADKVREMIQTLKTSRRLLKSV
ncbi:hypothetical protein SSIL_3708 [Solibacillus silvestris StLB046]|uniref:Uncharacterized protein n=1 Tax=Solibacillus silvestris (strain StLB046) TaxID=1002809 RepID=F2F555_SOLSS|nr:hypothetical protein [Solibacillus silvestris]BAK18131.1 hypothetical protein SSIL_3708 [Solibacillus silvestris StLB046]